MTKVPISTQKEREINQIADEYGISNFCRTARQEVKESKNKPKTNPLAPIIPGGVCTKRREQAYNNIQNRNEEQGERGEEKEIKREIDLIQIRCTRMSSLLFFPSSLLLYSIIYLLFIVDMRNGVVQRTKIMVQRTIGTEDMNNGDRETRKLMLFYGRRAAESSSSGEEKIEFITEFTESTAEGGGGNSDRPRSPYRFVMDLYSFVLTSSSNRAPTRPAIKQEPKPDIKKQNKEKEKEAKKVEEKLTPQERLKMKMRMALNKTSMLHLMSCIFINCFLIS